ncbi:MAG TPA: tetratricopeptide repeat protein [Usitatibacter sp.]|jgi:tetratricopeptide (TPR) repeat protein|nr:tetratricopeptide repeat protein [Usitatibacter sp.]
MLHRNPMWPRLAAILAAALIGAAAPAWSAPADDLRDAQKLYGQGKIQPAMEKVDQFLKEQPRDPQGRFLKGLLLTEQHRTDDAIKVFTGLTEDYPELPEPYNNLAVLYASQGNYDKAKSALELAIHTHPSYATAHENLGDIYAQLASRAYDRALQLDKSNTTAQVKLAMLKDIFSSQKLASAQPHPQQTAATTPAPAPKQAAPAPQPRVVAKSEPAKSEPAKTEPAKSAPPVVAAVESKAPPSSAASGSNSDAKAQVNAAVEGWARAWSSKDVKGYLAYYAPDFEVPKGETRSDWEKQREERITRPKSISVEAKILHENVNGNEASVTIRQAYKSDTLKSNSTKTLKLVKNGDRWQIKQERVGG